MAKRLAFKSVAVMACDDELLPLQLRVESAGDESKLDEIYDTERHLLPCRDHAGKRSGAGQRPEPASGFLEDLRHVV
jgi:hypothetical protein